MSDPVRWMSTDGKRVSKLPHSASDIPLYTGGLTVTATDQFQPPAVHRSGYSGRSLNGKPMSDFEWIMHFAERGGTLAAGEGAVLAAEIRRLESILNTGGPRGTTTT